MNYSMDIVDELVRRTKTTYRHAKEALDATGGNLLDAMIYLEEHPLETTPHTAPSAFFAKMKQLIDDGMVSQLQIRRNGQILFDLPLPVGVVGGLLYRLPALIFLGSAITTNCDIRVVKRDGSTCEFTDLTVQKIREFFAMAADAVKKFCPCSKKDGACEVGEVTDEQ